MIILLDCLYNTVWGVPAVVLILGIGCYLTIETGMVQIRLMPVALRMLNDCNSKHSVSPFRALCTALSATVGTGNIIGVSGAICMGGPGAVFWMQVCGFLGMAVKYGETVLSVRYRRKDKSGYFGGPMYLIVDGLGKKYNWLACVYALFGLLACFGIGTAAQLSAISAGIQNIINIPPRIIGIIVAISVGLVLVGGVSSIGRLAEIFIPAAASAYVILCLYILSIHWKLIPNALVAIVKGAFSPRAVTGGCIGEAFRTLQYGCSRGVFSNEAGLGTAAIAHASADVDHPAKQGALAIFEVFIDTFLICTLTAFAILCSGIPIPYGTDSGAEIIMNAFSACFSNFGRISISVFLVCFAYATILGWALYGARFAEFLFGNNKRKLFFTAQTVSILAFASIDTPIIWRIAATANGLMLVPNLLAIFLLHQEIKQITKDFFRI